MSATTASAASATTASPGSAPDPFDSLNPAQREAVEHGIGMAPGPPSLVVAVAGSSKTDTLAHRVARLIQSGADPQRILLLTFSRRAANEMGQRAAGVLQRVFGTAGGAASAACVTWP